MLSWRRTYSLAFLCTKETKLREFQFKLLHRRIATNDFLHKIGLKPNESCTFCGETTENLIHLFWKCKHTWIFWEETHRWICQNVNGLASDTFSVALCLGIVDDRGDLLLHHVLLIARYYIYTCRLRNTLPKLQIYTKKILSSMEIERQIAKDHNTLNAFKKKWTRLKSTPEKINSTPLWNTPSLRGNRVCTCWPVCVSVCSVGAYWTTL